MVSVTEHFSVAWVYGSLPYLGPQPYLVKPKLTMMYFGFTECTSNYKYTNAASIFTATAPRTVLNCAPANWRPCGLSMAQSKVGHSSSFCGNVTKELDASKSLLKAWRVIYTKESNAAWRYIIQDSDLKKCCNISVAITLTICYQWCAAIG